MAGAILLVVLCLGCLSILPITAGSAAAQGDDPAGRYVTINFNDVDINLFIKYISELTGKNFIVDRTVKGKVTIISPTRISEQDAYHVFESVLEVHGFTTVPSGSVIKIIPSVQARSRSIETLREGVFYPEDKVVTQLIPLTHTDPEEMKRLLAPLVSKSSVVIAHTNSGLLIITDFLSNINRLQEIIAAVDVPSVGEELVVLSLKHASAVNISQALSQLFVKTATRQGQRPQSLKLIPYERTNSLIVFASKASIEKVKELLERIDTPAPKGTGKIQVYYLQHASAEELVKVLTSLPDTKTSSSNPDAPAAVTAPLISKDVKIMADTETNSLIIIAPRDDYLVIEDVIKRLDIPRRMVYLEALIMEVQVTKQFKVGVDWGGAGSNEDGTTNIFTGFIPSDGSKIQGDNNIATDTFSLATGFSFGVLQHGVRIGDIFFPNLAAVVNAYKDDSDVEIIATPQILTTDNKEAEIKVGENVPYITSQQQNQASVNVGYNQYEYKDVGTTLKILPQINQSDLVRMEIDVEVSRVKSQANNTPTTLKRTANTTVVIRNKETVVMGGIIGQDTTGGEYKVPGLGDIPLLGWLFKTKSEIKAKTNLFIFITPHIVDNPAEITSIYLQKRDNIDTVLEGSGAIADSQAFGVSNINHAVALNDIGFSKLQEKDYGRARQYFEQALVIDPKNPFALLNLGIVYEKEGSIPLAVEMYRKVADMKPVEREIMGKSVGPDPQLIELRQRAIEDLRRLGVQYTPEPSPPSSEPPSQAPQ